MEDSEKTYINAIAIENSTLCAARCIICPREKYKGPLKNMEQSLFERCVEQAADCGAKVINLCGYGESLLDPEIGIKLKYIKDKFANLKTVLTTTGYRMKGELLNTICKYVDEINFSVYGMSKETYEHVHRGGVRFEENKSNIDSILNRADRPYTIVSFVDMPENHKDIEKWKEYYENLADQINIWRPHRWPHSGNPDMSFKNMEHCRCFRIDNLNGLYVKVNGEISPCCFDFNTELSLGNINDMTLQEILKGTVVKKLRKMQDNDELRSSKLICGDCDQIYSREDALIYSSYARMQSGKHTFLHAFLND